MNVKVETIILHHRTYVSGENFRVKYKVFGTKCRNNCCMKYRLILGLYVSL